MGKSVNAMPYYSTPYRKIRTKKRSLDIFPETGNVFCKLRVRGGVALLYLGRLRSQVAGNESTVWVQ